jgi:hypothetical protein
MAGTILADDIKTAMRMQHNELNADIQRNINAAILELQRVGISAVAEPVTAPAENPNNDLIRICIEFYVKWQFNFEGEGARYKTAFEMTRDSLSLSAAYREEEESDV